MATRKATIKMEKMNTNDMLKMVAQSTDAGFPVPADLLKSASNFKTVAKMYDSGYFVMHTTQHGYMYTITIMGRGAIS